MYKRVNGLLPRTFSHYFTSVHDTHKHHTRSHNNLFLSCSPAHHTLFTLLDTMDYMPLEFYTDLSIKSKFSVSQFKTSYRNLLVSQYMTMDMTQLSSFLPFLSCWIALFSSQHSHICLFLVIPLSLSRCCLFYVKAHPNRLLFIVIMPPLWYIK